MVGDKAPDAAVIDLAVTGTNVDGPAFDERAVGPRPSGVVPQRLHVAGSAYNRNTSAGVTAAARTDSIVQVTGVLQDG